MRYLINSETLFCIVGILPDDFVEEDEENIAPSLKGKTLKAVKAERMDSDDVDEQFSPKLISLSFTLSSNAQSWTVSKLPISCSMLKIQSMVFLKSVLIFSCYLLWYTDYS